MLNTLQHFLDIVTQVDDELGSHLTMPFAIPFAAPAPAPAGPPEVIDLTSDNSDDDKPAAVATEAGVHAESRRRLLWRLRASHGRAPIARASAQASGSPQSRARAIPFAVMRDAAATPRSRDREVLTSLRRRRARARLGLVARPLASAVRPVRPRQHGVDVGGAAASPRASRAQHRPTASPPGASPRAPRARRSHHATLASQARRQLQAARRQLDVFASLAGLLDTPNLVTVLTLVQRGPGAGGLGPPPAAKQEVRKMRTKKVTGEMQKRQGNCPVCLDTWSPSSKACELKCGHFFHSKCIKTWLKTRNTCPVCRYELKTDCDAYEATRQRHNAAHDEAIRTRAQASAGTGAGAGAGPTSTKKTTTKKRKAKAKATAPRHDSTTNAEDVSDFAHASVGGAPRTRAAKARPKKRGTASSRSQNNVGLRKRTFRPRVAKAVAVEPNSASAEAEQADVEEPTRKRTRRRR